MNAGYRTQLRRSSRIRQHSFPKTTITEPIDLVQFDSETMDQDGNQVSEQNQGDEATGKVWKKVELKFARKSNNQPKETAKRPKTISNDKVLFLTYHFFIIMMTPFLLVNLCSTGE